MSTRFLHGSKQESIAKPARTRKMAGAAHRDPQWTEWSTSGHRFVVPKHYSFLKEIGSGSYGVVCSAHDSRETGNGKVAIKKVADTFGNRVMFTRTLREIKLLRLLKHPNIVGIHALMMPKSYLNWKDVYVCMELMESDLGKIIASPQPLSEDHVLHFTYYILEAVRYIHSCNVVHRDLKPSNVLVNADCNIKVCDFGLARALGPTPEPTQLTAYVATRWYRAPEVLLSNGAYTKGLDMWSVGCICAELVGRRALFPGRDCRDQLERIFNVIGSATEDDIACVPTERAQKYLRRMRPRTAVPWAEKYPSASPELLELIHGLLQFTPKNRLSVEAALAARFFESIAPDTPMLHDDERPVINFDWEATLVAAGEDATERFQELMYEECRLYHPDAPSWQHFQQI